MRPRLTVEQYTNGILAGDRSLLSQGITLVESTLAADRKLAKDLINHSMPHAGHSFRVAITGVPGVGKSSFIEAIGSKIVEAGYKLAILAIDPSSSQSRGSILGDKTRMQALAQDPRVFIRPSPTAGTLGGVARSTRETILLCEAAGFDFIIVETVGVGQSETLVKQMTDFFMLLMLPGAGDELQGIKRGIIEMVDLMVINKADGANVLAAELAAKEYQSALHYLSPSAIPPQVRICSALTHQGLDEIVNYLQGYYNTISDNGQLGLQRKRQQVAWMHAYLQQQFSELFYENNSIKTRIEAIESGVMEGTLWPVEAAELLLSFFHNERKTQ
ncbi:methylmalonyl Co-A mutase-associated GTPase MeaB [Dyadobacter tibetensis]|uniref:methylmalonyl Co-A mutase-associated GTPase MeaB n=1 Tax=Dyadobacter tibetensis TaxID=1211851 RepID=UPI00046FEA75|nr:methylmalonyl Co-A mutase-associated GTPase MeaB [Dyadobacter tibetensis]